MNLDRVRWPALTQLDPATRARVKAAHPQRQHREDAAARILAKREAGVVATPVPVRLTRQERRAQARRDGLAFVPFTVNPRPRGDDPIVGCVPMPGAVRVWPRVRGRGPSHYAAHAPDDVVPAKTLRRRMRQRARAESS